MKEPSEERAECIMTKKKKKILIIDDDEAIRDGCRQVLSRKGYDVETTGNSVQGLESSLSDIYDIILLDLKMPVLGGMEFLKKIRQTKNSIRQDHHDHRIRDYPPGS